jgi:hypothetical protein
LIAVMIGQYPLSEVRFRFSTLFTNFGKLRVLASLEILVPLSVGNS